MARWRRWDKGASGASQMMQRAQVVQGWGHACELGGTTIFIYLGCFMHRAQCEIDTLLYPFAHIALAAHYGYPGTRVRVPGYPGTGTMSYVGDSSGRFLPGTGTGYGYPGTVPGYPATRVPRVHSSDPTLSDSKYCCTPGQLEHGADHTR